MDMRSDLSDAGIRDFVSSSLELIEAQLYISSEGVSVINGTIRVGDEMKTVKVVVREEAAKLLSRLLLITVFDQEVLQLSLKALSEPDDSPVETPWLLVPFSFR